MPNRGPNAKVRIVLGTQRTKIWRAMQIKGGKFSIADLCRCVLTGNEPVKNPRNSISRYVGALAKVGILVEMKRRLPPTSPTSNGEKRWFLVRDLGRHAPVVRNNGDVYDPNSDSLIPIPVTDQEAGHDD